ncbi:MAG TPA: hypothetical protein VIE39_10825, partial [Thermoanaerobaculia bacterium]
MMISKNGLLACGAAVLLSVGACQKKADDTSATVTPGAVAQAEPTAVPEPIEERVTADPLAANQKNAARRRRARESQPAS